MKKFNHWFKRAWLFVLTAVITAAPSLAALPIKAAGDPLWVNSQDPTFSVLSPAISANDPYTLATNEPCVKKTVTVTFRQNINNPFVKQEKDICAVQTSFGFVGKGGFLAFNNDRTAYKLAITSGRPLLVPNAKSLMKLVNTQFAGTNTLAIYDNPVGQLQKQPDQNYQYAYAPNSPASRTLENSDGQPLLFRAITTSDNGKWLLLEPRSSAGNLTRVNTETLEALTFPADVPSYGGGQDPSIHIAISNDGMHAAMAGSNVNKLKVYDLSTCGQQSADLLVPTAGCGKKDFSGFLNSKTGASQASGFGLRFNIDATELYFDTNGPNIGAMRVALTAPGVDSQQLDYLALGDSYSSGEGNIGTGSTYPYVPGTDGDNPAETGIDTSSEKCHISSNSYPYLLAQNMNIPASNFKSIACSGAEIKDIYGIANTTTESYDGQFGQLKSVSPLELPLVIKNSLANFTPGRTAQLDFVKKYKPKVITLTIGGNDIGFGKKISSCVVSILSCDYADDPLDRQAAGTEIQLLYEKLKNLYSDIMSASPQSKLYVIGYPKLAQQNGICGPNTLLDSAERTFLEEGVAYANTVIKSAARSVGVNYIDVQDSMGQALLCGDASPLAINGTVVGDDLYPLGERFVGFSSASYHPNSLGHQLMTTAILPQIAAGCSTLCPASFPKPSLTAYFDAGIPDTTPPSIQDFLSKNWIDTANSILRIVASNFAPNSQINVELHSTPTPLGTFTTTDTGALTNDVSIPNNLPVGPHTLHLFGTSPSGEKIDLYQQVWVLGPSDDKDEDGIVDNADPCMFVPAANVDHDQDGVDDACDGFISDPPADSTPPTVTGSADRPANGDGWYKDNVTINWASADPDPSSGAPTTPPPTIANLEGTNTYTSEPSCDPTNNCATGSLSLSIDKTAPLVTNTLNSAPNAAGWHNTDVTVSAECNDAFSGILTCGAPLTLATEGYNQTVTHFARDKADNEGSAASTVNIDKTAPILNAPAWTNNPKSTTTTANMQIATNDSLSGIEQAEYFLGDTDPGQGNGATMTIDGSNLTTNFGTDFPTGVYKVSVRAKDYAGNWSAPTSDYLVVYSSAGTRMTGKRTVLPSLARGDILPGLNSDNQDDVAKFGFNVRYTNQGALHANSDFQFSYKTGAKCSSPTKAVNCHSLELNASSISWLATQGQNNSTGVFQGIGRLEVDGAASDVTFRLTGIDGELLSPTNQDYLTLKIYNLNDNPNIAAPIYQATGEVLRGNIKIK